jgi:outer membrane protein
MKNSMLMMVILLAVQTASAGPRILTLDEALQIARAHQPQLELARANLAISQARVNQSLAPLLPQVSGIGQYQRSTANFVSRPGATSAQATGKIPPASFDTYNYWNFGVTASQLLYDFGKSSSKWRATEETLEAQRQTQRATLQQILANVRKAYFASRAAQAFVGVARETLANQERHFVQISGFVEAGTRPTIDLAQARTNRANAQVQLIQAQSAYETAKAVLNQAMGLETGTDYDVADVPFSAVQGEDQAPQVLIEQARATRPDLGAFSHQLQAEQSVLKSVRSAYWPSLSVSTGLTDAGGALDTLAWNWYVGATLNWPLFEGGLTRGQVQEAQATFMALRAQQDSLLQQIQLDVSRAQLAIKASQAALKATGDAVQSATEQLSLAEGRYQTGVGNAIELSDAQLTLTNAKAAQVQADYNLASARSDLLVALGRQ